MKQKQRNKQVENQIEIYTSNDGKTQIEVSFSDDTVWLNQEQLAFLFDQTKQNVSLHINNCFKEGELARASVVKESLTTAKDGKNYKVKHYNLDVIISVGYRVKSRRGTQFRIWATQRLKDFLIQGYAINEHRLAQKQQEVKRLKNGIQILGRVITDQATNLEKENLLNLFSKGLELLDDYDHEQLDTKGLSTRKAVYPGVDDYLELVSVMRREFDSDLFGTTKDESFQSSVKQIQQSFNAKDLYPSLEEKASILLCLIVKNHSFIDGNKRIAASCFLYFLEQNKMLINSDGKPIMSNEALATLTLFIAVCKSSEIETVQKLVVSILNRNKKA
jgi:prophage maintenance system killer protein